MTYNIKGPQLLGRRLTAWGVALTLAVMAFAGFAASGQVDKAEAYSSAYFCAPNGSYVVINAGQRCVDHRRVRHRFLRATIYVGDGPGNFCVGAKQNSDGTGGNTKSFGCHIPTLDGQKVAMTPTDPSPGSPLGYATIINTTGLNDFFTGYMEWYP